MKFLLQSGATERRLFFALLIVLLGFGALYGYFVNQTVINVVDRKNIESEIGFLVSEVGEMEAVYIEKKNTLTLERAREMGFVEIPNPSYIARTDSATALTLNDDTPNE